MARSTFGLRQPVILLPTRFERMSREVQGAILAHELLHVRRKDWVWTCCEELVRSLFWFHPAMVWLIGRIQTGQRASRRPAGRSIDRVSRCVSRGPAGNHDGPLAARRRRRTGISASPATRSARRTTATGGFDVKIPICMFSERYSGAAAGHCLFRHDHVSHSAPPRRRIKRVLNKRSTGLGRTVSQNRSLLTGLNPSTAKKRAILGSKAP